ncbi:unnamed protein product, partial [Mesorhabditis spiculigera]
MSGLVDGRVVIITGAGRGIGRAHALALLPRAPRSSSTTSVRVPTVPRPVRVRPSRLSRRSIAAGGQAVVNGDDVADWAGAENLIKTAIDTFGGLDVLVNNAGFLRDRMLVGMSEGEWDAVIRVHLKGTSRRCVTLLPTGALRPRQARPSTHASSTPVRVQDCKVRSARAAAELKNYGVSVNAIAPAARTRMTVGAGGAMAESMAAPEEGFDAMAPENISPLVVWLGSAEVQGRHGAGVRGRGRKDHRRGGLASRPERGQG